MNSCLVFCVAGLAVVCAVHGFTVQERITEVIADFDKDAVTEAEVTVHSRCSCYHSTCICHSVEDGLRICVILAVVEFRKRRCRHAIIEAKFIIEHEIFVHLFLAGRIEDFCHTVKHERLCFRIDIHDSSTAGLLTGCLRLSRPKKLNIGCFQLPLMTSESEDMLCEENAEDDNDFLLNVADSTETFAGKTDNGIDVSLTGMPEYRAVAEMEVPVDSDNMKISDCICNKYECHCEGSDDGYKVSVVLIVNEVRHGDNKHIRIQAMFRVDESVFRKTFDVAKFEDFCHTVDGNNFCFDVDVSKVRGSKIHGCMSMTKPKKIKLGCFNIPLLTSHPDYDITSDDE